MSKSVFILSPDIPYPADQGCRRDIWEHICFFNRYGLDIVLVICDANKTIDCDCFEKALPISGVKCYHVHRASPWTNEEAPNNVKVVQALIDKYQPHVIWCEYAHFSSLVDELSIKEASIWFRSHNFELLHALDKALVAREHTSWRELINPAQLISSAYELFIKMSTAYRKEKLMHQIAEKIFYIGHSDLCNMSVLYGESVEKIWLPPILEIDRTIDRIEKDHLDVLFLGKMTSNNNPNVAGAKLLLETIVPAIEKALPNTFKFHIVGRGSQRRFAAFESDTVCIHDYLPDLSAFIKQMDIACYPLRYGWGCKIKVVEALSIGLPVIGAPQTFRGFPEIKNICLSCQSIEEYVDGFRKLQSWAFHEQIARLGEVKYRQWKCEGENSLSKALNKI